MNAAPKVFISYSWEDEAHKVWVKKFADRLIGDGVNVDLDQYDLNLGDRLPQFMENEIASSDYVLIICTPQYKTKSDARTGGVGYEGHIISDELLSKHKERKFIPVIRKGSVSESMPRCLAGKLGIDLTGNPFNEACYEDLLTTIFGNKTKPKIGTPPKYVSNKSVVITASEDEPIKILGIITDEVTVPKMDGTRGSALYKIPFRLSKTPNELWRRLFVESWNFPPSFSTMHRPGIASVSGNKIILNGTTIDEVKQYHRDTLILCVDEANKKAEQIMTKERLQKEREEKRIADHNRSVNQIANEITF